MSRTNFCKKYVLSPSSLAKWELGKIPFAEKSAKKLAEAFHEEGVHVSPEWLLTGEGIAAQKEAKTKTTSKLSAKNEKELIEKELYNFENFHGRALSLRIYDDSCLPLYLPGDYLAGVALTGEQILTLRDMLCLVQLSNGIICVRKLIDYNEDTMTFDLECANPFTEVAQPKSRNVHLKAAAPITFFRRPLS